MTNLPSPLCLDEIISIEDIGPQETYDFSIPGSHNFIANGILVHNSGALEQDAFVVMFLFRQDYYTERDMMRVPEGKQEKNILEILVLKNKEGPIGTLKVFYNAKTGRISSLALEKE